MKTTVISPCVSRYLLALRPLIASLLVGAAAVLLAHLAGASEVPALVLGIIAGVAVWRPPPTGEWQRPPALGQPARGPGLELGRIAAASPRSVPLVPGQFFWLNLAETERHVTLIGTTGSGKTTTLSRLMDAAMAAGWSVVVVDAKGGRLVNVCRALGVIHRLPARIWLPGHSASWTYDICAGDPAAIGNRLIGAFEHGRDGQVYRNLSQALVPLAAKALIESGKQCTLDSLRYSLDEAHLSGLARRVPDVALSTELMAMLYDALHRKALSGVAGRLRSLRHGVFGAWLLPSERTLDLADSLRTPGVTYLGLPATAASEDVALVGRVLIQHLKQLAYASLWAEESYPALVVFDEFASLGEAHQLLDLLLQAREGRLAIVVSTQQLPTDAVLRKALLSAGTLIVHQIGAPEDAEPMARALGTRYGSEVVRQIQLGPGVTLVRRLLRSRESYLISPDQIVHLPIGRAAVCVRFAEQRIAVVQVDPLRLNPKGVIA